MNAATVILTLALLSGPPRHVVASWYGQNEAGRITASGQRFDPRRMTVASRTLPLGSLVLLSYHGRAVVALVSDRGPYTRGRSLDCSEAVAEALGFKRRGVAVVSLYVLGRSHGRQSEGDAKSVRRCRPPRHDGGCYYR